MDYYNFLFTDLAGNNIRFIYFDKFVTFILFPSHRSQNKSLAIDFFAMANINNFRRLFVLREIVGSTIYGQ